MPDAVLPPPAADAADAAAFADAIPVPSDDDNAFGQVTEDAPVPTLVITGAAGTGKTTWLRAVVEQIGANHTIFTATTGIAAVNLGVGVTTIHSALRFSTLESLRQAYIQGRLQRAIASHMKQGKTHLIIDEMSMLSAPMLDLIFSAVAEVGNRGDRKPMTVILSGDWCQLPPVRDEKDPTSGKFAFQAECWDKFAANTQKLTTVWRQSEPDYLRGLWAMRSGDGMTAAEALQRTNATWSSSLNCDFPGTTIMAVNADADRHNYVRLNAMPGEAMAIRSHRWWNAGVLGADQPAAWRNIPDQLHLKIGAFVMILANQLPDFDYVNGDTGTLVGFNPKTGAPMIRLVRQRPGFTPEDNIVEVPALLRHIEQAATPSEFESVSRNDWPKYDPKAMTLEELWAKTWPLTEGAPGGGPQRAKAGAKPAWYNKATESWVVGSIYYAPLRLAYATTVHKSQGLTLDRVQIDLGHRFLGEAGMAYVAASRCRTSAGLQLVGTPELLARRVKVDTRILPWL